MDNFNKPGVYIIENKVSGKVYVGSSKNIRERFLEHICDLRAQRHSNIKLQRAWNKYEEENFEFKPLEFIPVLDKILLLSREQYWLDEFNAAKNGYNLSPTAGSTLGYRFSDESKRRISENRRGIKFSQTHRANLKKSCWNASKHLPDEMREKISNSLKGKVKSLETRKRMSECKIGKPLSETHKQALKDAWYKRAHVTPPKLFNPDQVIEIKGLLNAGTRIVDICKMYNCNRLTVRKIKQDRY